MKGIMRFSNRLSKGIDRYDLICGTIALLSMTAIAFYSIISRFVLNSALRWSEEVVRYLMLYICWMGVGMGFKEHKHMGIELFTALKPQIQKAIKIVVAIITLIIVGVFTYLAAITTIKVFNSGQVAAASHIPMWIAYATIPVGYFGGVIRQIEQIYILFTTPADDLIPKGPDAEGSVDNIAEV